MDLGLSGKKALITGSTKGLGRAIAETLVAEGASVAICSRTQDDTIIGIACWLPDSTQNDRNVSQYWHGESYH